MKDKIFASDQVFQYKYCIFVCSLAVIIYGIGSVFALTAPIPFLQWTDKLILYVCIPLAIVTTFYYLHFFLPKYRNGFQTAKPFLLLLVLCSGLCFVTWLNTGIGMLSIGFTLGEINERWGACFPTILLICGWIGLSIPRKSGYILLLICPCYMIYKFFIQLFFVERIGGTHWGVYYPYWVFCLIFPVICSLPVVRNRFRLYSIKELLLCLVAAVIITIPFVLFTKYITLL